MGLLSCNKSQRRHLAFSQKWFQVSASCLHQRCIITRPFMTGHNTLKFVINTVLWIKGTPPCCKRKCVNSHICYERSFSAHEPEVEMWVHDMAILYLILCCTGLCYIRNFSVSAKPQGTRVFCYYMHSMDQSFQLIFFNFTPNIHWAIVWTPVYYLHPLVTFVATRGPTLFIR